MIETAEDRTSTTAKQQTVSGPPRASARTACKAVLVHAGARDSYQLALALHEAGLLDALVTDLFWSEEEGRGAWLKHVLPASALSALRKRSRTGLSPSVVKMLPLAGLGSVLLDRLPRVPFALKRQCIRWADQALGRAAGRRARRHHTGLVSYSYTGYDAFRAFGRGGLLFQVHPHPETMRRILREELTLHPECRTTLLQEWELSLSEKDFNHLVEEPRLASSFLAASSFTKQSLIENGVPPEQVTVVPYGIDLLRFHPDAAQKSTRPNAPLQLLFVGRINQRKGLAYLLEALKLLREAGIGADQVQLTICGRVLDDLSLFGNFGEQITIRPSVSAEDLVRAYQSADLFVFPSVGEGFGQVLLESLASGLPILATTHTAAPDLIEDGVQGFIVEPRRPEELARHIVWSATHRDALAEMGRQARTRAEFFTWERFRSGTAEAVRQFLAQDVQGASSTGRSR